MINAGKAPNWAFMQYSRASWAIENLVLVPAHFLVPDAVEPRKPLSATARRHGWVGSNILLYRLPIDARIFLVKNSVEMPKTEVREAFSRFSFLLVRIRPPFAVVRTKICRIENKRQRSKILQYKRQESWGEGVDKRRPDVCTSPKSARIQFAGCLRLHGEIAAATPAE